MYNSQEHFVSSAILGVVSNMKHHRLGKKIKCEKFDLLQRKRLQFSLDWVSVM